MKFIQPVLFFISTLLLKVLVSQKKVIRQADRLEFVYAWSESSLALTYLTSLVLLFFMQTLPLSIKQKLGKQFNTLLTIKDKCTLLKALTFLRNNLFFYSKVTLAFVLVFTIQPIFDLQEGRRIRKEREVKYLQLKASRAVLP